MSFPPYASYADSHVEWLGQVPSGWTYRRFKTIFRERDERSLNGAEELLSVSAYTGVSPRSEIIASDDHLTRADSLIGYKKCESNDLVVNIMLAWNRGLGFARQAGIVSPAYSVFYVLDDCVPSFLDYLVRSDGAIRYFKAHSSGVIDSRLRLYPEEFLALGCCLPPVKEQRAIADFLDRETAKIDALVEAQRRLIALLKEKRQAVISNAVTKGLDPSTPLKPSGIEWLGDVPAHWDVVALCRIVQSRRPITYGIVQPGPPDPNGRYMIRGQDYSSGWVPLEDIFRVSSAIEEPYKRARVRSGDLVMTIVGAGVGNVATIPDELEGANLTQTTARIAPDHSVVDQSFLELALNSDLARIQVAIYQKGAAQPGLNLEHLKAFRLPLPPVAEQGEIARHLLETVPSLSLLVEEAEKACLLLIERRAPLISAAVTGKIDVRGWTAEQVRDAVGAEIVHLHARDRTFGRVQNQKLLFLAQGHAGVDEIGGRFQRQAAGPHDSKLMASIEEALTDQGVLRVSQPGGAGSQVTYSVTSGTRPDRARLRAVLGAERLAKLDHVLAALANEDTRGVEAVATLYGVWNDALLDGETPDDDRLVRGFMEWHPEKRVKFSADDVRNRIAFMRRNGLVPEGRGARTQVGALL